MAHYNDNGQYPRNVTNPGPSDHTTPLVDNPQATMRPGIDYSWLRAVIENADTLVTRALNHALNRGISVTRMLPTLEVAHDALTKSLQRLDYLRDY